MKKSIVLTLALCLALIGCKTEPTLQKYFVQRTEDKDFIALDISPTILNVKEEELSVEQKEALEAFDKMNIIAFKLDENNKSKFETERAEVAEILKDEKYQQLMKVGKGKETATVSFVGDEDNIDEFVLYANKNDMGFAVVRILGNDMNPTHIMNLMTMLDKSKVNMDQLEPLQDIFGKSLK